MFIILLFNTSKSLERSFNNFVEDTIILAQLKNSYFSNNEKIFFNVNVEILEIKQEQSTTPNFEKFKIVTAKVARTRLAYGPFYYEQDNSYDIF